MAIGETSETPVAAPRRVGPLVVAALALASGIGLRRAVPFPISEIGLACVLALAFLALLSRRLIPLGGAIRLAPAFVFLGAYLYDGWLSSQPPGSELARFAGQKVLLEGRIETSPDLLREQTVFDLEAASLIWNGRAEPASGKVRVRVMGRLPDLDCGQRVRVRAILSVPSNFGNPGEFDSVSYLRARGIGTKAWVPDPFWVEVRSRDPVPSGGLRVGIERFRTRASRFLDGCLPPDTAEIYKALVIGKEAGIPAKEWRDFAETGTAHLLAISGMNVAIVSIVVYAGLRACLARIPALVLRLNLAMVCAAVSFLPAMAYAAVAGWRVSTERSILMLGCYLGAVFLGRESETLNALGLAAILCLLRRPASLFEPGFQLSFAAVAALVLSGWSPSGPADAPENGVARWWMVPARWLKGLAWATFAAQLGTTPLTLLHFQTLVVLGMAANLVAVPLLGFLAVCPGLMGLCLMDTWPSASEILFIAGGWVVDLGCWCVGWIAKLPLASIRLPPPCAAEMAVAYLGIGAFFVARETRRGRAVIALTALFLVSGQAVRAADRAFHGDLRVLFASVGQGDCTLVEIPGGKVMLVDGGGWAGSDLDVGERIVLPLLWRRGIRSIDLVVLSHPQWDHMGGLLAVVERMRVGEFWWSGVREGGASRSLDRLLEALRSSGTVVREVGANLDPVRIGAASLHVLHPPGVKLGEGRGGGANDDSLVLKLVFGVRSLLLTGDIEAAAEADLLRAGSALDSQILKVPHHGSPTSSTEAFVLAVRPSLAVVPVGSRPSARFPAPEVVDRYRSAGSEVVGTGEGAVLVRVVDGKAWWCRGNIRGWGAWQPIDFHPGGAVALDSASDSN